MRKILAIILSLTVLLGITTTAYATDATAPGQAATDAVLAAEATRLDITVPTAVLIYVDAFGNVITPDNVPIVNNSTAPVLITSLAVTTINGWTLDSATTDYKTSKVGLKNFCLTFNGKDPSSGPVSFDMPIYGSDSLNLDLFADVAPQKEALMATKIGNIVITVDWYADESVDKDTRYPEGYVLATDADFEGDFDGGFKYVGTDAYVVIPNTIKGIQVTSYAYMFYQSAIRGVISKNPNVTNMEGMFSNTSSDILELDLNTSAVTNMRWMFRYADAKIMDLSSFDTSAVTNMEAMFSGAAAETLDLTSFNTSNVTNMGYMFFDSKALSIKMTSFDTSNVINMVSMFNSSKVTILDLSSFDTSKADLSGMFFNTGAIIGYARTQADIDRYTENDGYFFITKIPDGLVFTIK